MTWEGEMANMLRDLLLQVLGSNILVGVVVLLGFIFLLLTLRATTILIIGALFIFVFSLVGYGLLPSSILFTTLFLTAIVVTGAIIVWLRK